MPCMIFTYLRVEEPDNYCCYQYYTRSMSKIPRDYLLDFGCNKCLGNTTPPTAFLYMSCTCTYNIKLLNLALIDSGENCQKIEIFNNDGSSPYEILSCPETELNITINANTDLSSLPHTQAYINFGQWNGEGYDCQVEVLNCQEYATPTPPPSDIFATSTPTPNPTSAVPTPTPQPTPASIGSNFWVGGNNYFGQLGNGNSINYSSMIQTLMSGNIWLESSVGYAHTAGITTDNKIWTWGLNNNGQLGDNSIINKSSPVLIDSLIGWSQVLCGYNTTAAIKFDGSLWLWGCNAYGNLGDNTIFNRSLPVQTLCAGNNWLKASVGSGHTAVIKKDFTLWLFGSNNNGELGINSSVYGVSSPVQTVCATADWRDVAAGNSYTLAVKNDGTLWGWGFNAFGNLGNNFNNSVSSPVQIAPAYWSSISAGFYASFGIGNQDANPLNFPTPTPTSTPSPT